MIYFPRATEMFQFARLSSRPYVFRPGSRRITGAGFPHSGIHGSKAVQRLTVAYRSRPRPSSTPDAKASTVCPSYLDGDQSSLGQLLQPPERAGDTQLNVGQLCGFQGPARGRLPRRAPSKQERRRGRSLKTQQHVCLPPAARGHQDRRFVQARSTC